MKKFLPILILLLVIALGGVFFFKKPNNQTPTETVSATGETSSQSNPSTDQAAAIAPTNKATSELGENEQAEIFKCFGSKAKNMDEFKLLAEARSSLGRSEASTEWKNIHFTDNEGKKFRLRLEKEPTEGGKVATRLKLFSVDAEDLPDLIEIPKNQMYNPSDRVIRSFLDGKTVNLEQELKVIPLADGEMRLETENGKPVSLELESKAIRASCSTKFQTSCKCFSAAN